MDGVNQFPAGLVSAGTVSGGTASVAADARGVSASGGNPVPATPGWDYVTGRGTPDISAFVANP